LEKERDVSADLPQEVPYNSKTKKHGLKMRQKLLKEPELLDPTRPNRPGRKSKDRKINWDEVRVFAKPELRLNYKLSANLPGKMGPLPWIEAAVKSGLAATVSPNAGSRGGALMVPFDGRRKHIPKIDLAQLIKEGMENTLRQLEALPKNTNTKEH
jgi:hypothetical protein